jgi:DNA-binding MarR family transcriptional regulator
MSSANRLGALALAVIDGYQTVIAARVGLDIASASALNAIGFRPGCSIRELSQLLALTHPGAVRCADRLQAAGLIKRRSGADARTVALHLTQLGTRRWQDMRHARMQWLDDLLSDMPSTQRAFFDTALSQLLIKLAVTPAASERICRLCDEHRCVGAGCPITPVCEASP